MFRVERSDVMSDLWARSRAGSVLLSGSPGVGKSWTIGQFIRMCKREDRPHVAFAAEDFDVRSLNELNSVLGFKNDIISVLSTMGADPVLIIDGLDALRGETSQRAFRELIQNTLDKLPNCAIVASIRTFDLQQSEELRSLFFSVGSGNRRQFTNLTVAPFSDADLQIVCQQVPAIERLLRESSADFRELLRNPFNLHIAAWLIEAGAHIDEFSTVHSQVQLLGKYWRLRVEAPADGVDRKAMLRHILRQMIGRNALSLPEELAYSPGLAAPLQGLCSSEVLRKSITDRISFAHNILFDYALARLILDEEEVFRFVREDSTRTIFFRPSLSYFFHYLWWRDRELFWKIALEFFANPDLPERAKVIPAVVITEASRSISDLQPVLREETSTINKGITLILRSLQALGSLQSAQRALWLELLTNLSTVIRVDFINEYVALLGITNQSRTDAEEASVGIIARRLLLWMWRKSGELPQHNAVQLNTVAISRVFPVVMSTYKSDVAASNGIVATILSRFGIPESSSNEAFWLSHEIRRVVDNDPAVAVEVYRKMFSYVEVSEERTSMGGSLIVPMTSTRKQDFESGIYGLTMGFQHFLDVAPSEAALAAVLSTNAEVKRARPLAQDKEKFQEFSFEFSGQMVTYVADFSEIWDRGAREYDSLKLLDAALQAAVTRPQGEQMIRIIGHNAQVAVCWKRLLEAASANANPYYQYIRPLLRIPEFIAAPEVTIAAGNVIKAAFEADLFPSAIRN